MKRTSSLIVPLQGWKGTIIGDQRVLGSDYGGAATSIDTISDGVVERLVGGRLSIAHEDKYSHTVGQRNHLQGGR